MDIGIRLYIWYLQKQRILKSVRCVSAVFAELQQYRRVAIYV